MSGEGFLPFDRQRAPGTCLCGRALVQPYAPCVTCEDERRDHIAGGDFIAQPHEDYSVND